jgi:hypothetical protein
MTDGVAEFERSVLECLDDISRLLPGLSLRYDMAVITRAMAEHVGWALWAMRGKNLCDTRQAEVAIRHLEAVAFRGENVPMP